MQGAPWPVEATNRSSLESYLRWLDGQAGVTGTYEYVTEPTGDEQPVLSVRYMDCPQPGTLLGFTFGISAVANPLWGGLRPELAICVDSADARWAWALADIGDRVRTTSVFLPGDTIEIGESISPESPMEAFVLWHQLITDEDEAIFRMSDHEVVLVQAIPLHQVELEHLRRQTDRAVGVKTLLRLLSEQGLELTDVHRDPLEL
jgi:Suppressor of fused protein (SUFU)